MRSRTGVVYVCPQTIPPLSKECGYTRLVEFRHKKVTGIQYIFLLEVASCFMKSFIVLLLILVLGNIIMIIHM